MAARHLATKSGFILSIMRRLRGRLNRCVLTPQSAADPLVRPLPAPRPRLAGTARCGQRSRGACGCAPDATKPVVSSPEQANRCSSATDLIVARICYLPRYDV